MRRSAAPEGASVRRTTRTTRVNEKMANPLASGGARRVARFLIMAALAPAGLPWAQEGPPPALVVAAPVTLEPVTQRVELLGTVRPILDSLVASEVEGRVASREVERGERARQGQVLVRLDDSRLAKDLERALAERDDLEAQLELATLQERRARELHDEAILSQGDLDEAVARRQSLEGRTQAVVARIASIRDDLARTAIVSPFSGVVTELHTEVGQWVGRGDAVARLANLETLEIRLEVPERYYAQLSVGAPAPAVVDAIPGLSLEGKIFAVGRQGPHEMVWVVEGGVVRAVPVRTGRPAGSRVEVTGDLQAGQTVVVRGNERLTPGQAVRVEGGEPPVAATAQD
jgi:multidrug efflux pump subunit AcrA (membrane-fusion protein)